MSRGKELFLSEFFGPFFPLSKFSIETILLMIFLTEIICADDYKWNLIGALNRNDLQTIETILRTNCSAMSSTEKDL
jgi:hypothetical protein